MSEDQTLILSDFAKVIDFNSLYQSYTEARKGKRWKYAVCKYEVNVLENLMFVHFMLSAHKYRLSPYNCFIVKEPKERLIMYNSFRDKIVQHLFEDLALRVVKFEVSTGSGLMANHPVFSLDGAMLERELSFAEEHRLVVVIDIGKLGSPSSQIDALRRAVLRHPKVKFVVCHLLAPKQSELSLMAAGLDALHLPNVWFDLASLQHNVRPDAAPYPVTRAFIHKAIEIVGAERLLFGTDLPSNLCKFSYADMVNTIAEDTVLAEEQRQCILYNNALDVFWDGGIEKV